DWSLLTKQLVCEERLPSEYEDWNIRELTGLLPRELHRFCKAWNMAKQLETGVNKETVMETYMNLAVEYFKIKVQRLLDRQRLGNAVEDSTIFAAKVFMGSEMWNVPESWKVSGMVFFNGLKYHFVCPPAEQAIYEVFDDEHLQNAIAILREDENIRWRILELCVQH
ncbi:9480_t:CDS:1, partial [Paraglomus brasilianum]